MNIPSNPEHVSEQTRNDISITCFHLKIHDEFEVRAIFGFVRCSRERNINIFTSDPLVEVIFNLKAVLGYCNKLNVTSSPKTRLTSVCTNAMVDVGSVSFSKNSGCITPSSSLFLNQTLLIIVCMIGAQNIPRFHNRILDVNCQQQYNLNMTATTVHLVNETISFQ